jgi:hypothetical protein
VRIAKEIQTLDSGTIATKKTCLTEYNTQKIFHESELQKYIEEQNNNITSLERKQDHLRMRDNVFRLLSEL